MCLCVLAGVGGGFPYSHKGTYLHRQYWSCFFAISGLDDRIRALKLEIIMCHIKDDLILTTQVAHLLGLFILPAMAMDCT